MSKITIVPHFQLVLENGHTAVLSREDLFGLREKIDRWLKRTIETGYKEIQQIVADAFAITVPQLLSFNRSEDVSIPRMIAMLMCREFLPDQTTERIGAAFHRNHSMVVHACKRAEELLSLDKNLAARVTKIRARLAKEFAIRHLNTEPEHPVPYGSTTDQP